jgi:hypothetical protein
MITQSLFLLLSSRLLRVATSYPWRTDVAQDGIVGRAARAIGSVMGPIQAATGVAPNGEMAAHPAIGAARGVTAAIRRSMEGTRTGSGTRLRFKALTQTAKNASPTPFSESPRAFRAGICARRNSGDLDPVGPPNRTTPRPT